MQIASFISLVAFCVCWSAIGQERKDVGTTDSYPKLLRSEHLPNPIEVHQGLISGGLPESEEAFRELQQRGVKTLISVDGVRPDIQFAERFGLRYVHIPHGYDGIPEASLKKLVKTVLELPGPTYIHCHHGKHRSPTAAAAVCVAQEWMSSEQAKKILDLAGTSPTYKGLFLTVERTKPISRDAIASFPFEFESQCDVSPLIDTMVLIDEKFGSLKKLADKGWVQEESRIDYAHESVLLREAYEELARMESIGQYGKEFLRQIETSQRFAESIERILNARSTNKPTNEQRLFLNSSWKSLKQSCVECHQRYRDPPK